MVLYLCQRIKIFSIIDHGYLFISKFIIYSRLDSDHHSVSMHGLFWGVGAALRPHPRCCCWPGSESGLDTSATPPHYSLHCPGPRTLHQPFLILTLILMNTVKCTFKDRALVCKACWKPKVKAQKAPSSIFRIHLSIDVKIEEL